MVLLLVVIYITFISLGLPDSLFGVAWPVAHIDFGIEESFGSLYSVIVSVTTGGITFFAGSLIRKFGTGLVTAVSVLITAVSMLCISFAPNIWVMMLCAILGGFGAGAIDAGLNSFVSLHYKAIHMNWLHCFWGLGITISPLIMSYFLEFGDWKSGYRTVSYIQFAITLIVFLSLILWKKYDVRKKEEILSVKEDKIKVKFVDIIKTKGLIYATMSLGFYCGMEQLLIVWGASFLVNSHSFNPDVASRYISAYYGGIMLGRFFAGIISLKVHDKILIRGGMALSFVGIMLLFVPNNIIILIGLLLIGMGFGPIFPAIIHLIPERFGAEKSADITGIHMGGAYALGFGIQLVFGYTATATTFDLAPYFLLGTCILCIIFTEIINKKSKNTK